MKSSTLGFTGDRLQSLCLVLPVPMRVQSQGILFESQAYNGLNRWADHFSSLTVACPLMPERFATADGSIQWLPVTGASVGHPIEFVPLPWAYAPTTFLRAVPSTGRLLRRKIEESRYLSFAIGGMIGDWAAIASVQAMRLRRPYSVWTDRVETDVIRQSLPKQKMTRRWFNRIQLPLMEWYHHWIIRKSSLGLFHGQDCYRAYAPYSKNPHCVHDIHLKASDQISDEELAQKCRNALSTDILRICYAGRMEEMKGPIDWLRIIAGVTDRGVPVQATWFGDGALREEMLREIDQLGISSHVRLPGFCSDRAQLLSELRSHSVFLFCHKTPESPRCLIESLICGTPLVGYGSAYPEDLLSSNGGGVLTSMNNVPAVVDAIVKLHQDRERLLALSRQAAETGREFNDEAVFRHRSELIKKYLP